MNYILSVSEVNRYIKEIVSRDLVLSNLWVRGEISNFKYHYSGHMYFTIKDEGGLLKCVMFRTNAQVLRFTPENGLKVIIRGYVSVFERDGQYQLYAEEMQPDGLGSLHMAFEQLKKRLQAEGLFDVRHKKKIPFLPRTVGVVTSSTGSVIRDIMNIINRRFPNVELKIFPVAVQGDQAPKQIARAIGRFNELDSVDVIIVARGGGSLEELWAFNEELVARSIYESRIPVISAVGHETDFTIADFAADLRAPTPSAAAEMVVPEREQLGDRLVNLNLRLKNALGRTVKLKRAKYEGIMNSTVFRQPYDRVYQERMRLDVLNKYMHKAMDARNESVRLKFKHLVEKLDALSPLTVLSRGYSVARHSESGRIIRHISDIKAGDRIEVVVAEGRIDCTVEGTESSNRGNED